MATAPIGNSEMEGDGYYNAHSRPQGSAGELGIPLLKRAAQQVPLSGDIVRIADFGAAQGKNSMAPMSAAIAEIRKRCALTPITITHTDISSNDFTALFELLAESPASYLNGAQDVYAYASGTSFYRRIFPSNTQAIGWNSIAIHWLSSAPSAIPNQIWSHSAQGTVRAAFRARAAQDWTAFLNARAAEYVQGGQLVIVASGADEHG